MKKLSDLEKQISQLKELIRCQEIGNDMYYSSPLYQKQLFELQALECEEMVLKGKLPPYPISFKKEEKSKRAELNQMAQEKGLWYAEAYNALNEDDFMQIKR